ncbi:MAG: hypothetical protein PVH21_07820 [Myxococcales bacterium]|jgi:hypothetical protein
MKVSNLVWILAFGGIVAAACNSGPAIGTWPPDASVGGSGGTGGTGGTGATGGTGGTGGVTPGACTGGADQAAYASLTYTDADGVDYTGVEAASAIGSDCIFGSSTSTPALTGCANEAYLVLGCFPNCDDATIQILADCVAQCVQDVTGLSSDCVACTGDTVACGAAFCTNVCVSDTNSPECVGCRCDNNCIQAYDDCTGLPPTTTCP